MYFASIELTRQSVVTEVVMGIDAEDFRMFVIRPTLQKLGVSGTAAELLLLGTAAAESSLGAFFKSEGQRTSGIYRMHGQTHRHIWDD